MERNNPQRLTVTPYKRQVHHEATNPSQSRHSEHQYALPPEIACLITTAFDAHLERLHQLQKQLNVPPVQHPEVPKTTSQPQIELLPGTQKAIARLTNIPLLPAPKQVAFEEVFQPFDTMFQVVFYRRYHSYILDDMKQQGLLALWKKWQKDPKFFENTPSFIVTAAIFGAGNYRQKQIKLRRLEESMRIDGQDKVIGATKSQREHDSWEKNIDRRLDVEFAVRCLEEQFPTEQEKEWTHHIVRKLKNGYRSLGKTLTSRVEKRQYIVHRDHVTTALRAQLYDYSA